MRPQPVRWFELFTPREDVTVALAYLARTGAVELECRSADSTFEDLAMVSSALAEFREYERLYRPFWPLRDLRASAFPEPPATTLERCSQRIRDWSRMAEELVMALQRQLEQLREFELWEAMLAALGDSELDFSQLLRAGPLVCVRWVATAADASIEIPPRLLVRNWQAGARQIHLVIGSADDIALLEKAAVSKPSAVAGPHRLPAWLCGGAHESLEHVRQRIPQFEQQIEQLHARLRALNDAHDMACVLGDIYRLRWVADEVGQLDATGQFAWITGWTCDRDGQGLAASIGRCNARALIHFPAPPEGLAAPLLLVNPPWARPFEVFSRAMGMPARNEADPSRLLALVVPLLFGYMFGDVGQGLVLACAAFLLRKRFPIARLFIAGGLCAAAFGALFGSVFSVETVLPALWLRPLESPLTVLAIPLFFGALLLTVGLLINGLEAWWSGESRRWMRVEIGILGAYLGILLGFAHPVGFAFAAAAAGFTFAAESLARRSASAGAVALGGLVEQTLQLLINTLSFARVGAFALAHAGLSAAIVTLVNATEGPLPALLILVLGNAFVLTLETLAVSIQTTRLVLFEFFTRFLAAGGRAFRPLLPPPFLLEEYST